MNSERITSSAVTLSEHSYLIIASSKASSSLISSKTNSHVSGLSPLPIVHSRCVKGLLVGYMMPLKFGFGVPSSKKYSGRFCHAYHHQCGNLPSVLTISDRESSAFGIKASNRTRSPRISYKVHANVQISAKGPGTSGKYVSGAGRVQGYWVPLAGSNGRKPRQNLRSLCYRFSFLLQERSNRLGRENRTSPLNLAWPYRVAH